MNPFFAKKKRVRTTIANGEMETSAIGDMAFLLLIFFIVTSSFMMKQGIFLSLPSTDGGAVKVSESELFEITPLVQGYMYKDKQITEKQALAYLEEQKQKVEEVIFVIYMNQNIRYERLIDTLSIARKTEIKKISIKDEQEKGRS